MNQEYFELNTKIKRTEKGIRKKIKARFQITEAIRAKKLRQEEVILQLKNLNLHDEKHKRLVEEKLNEIEDFNCVYGNWHARRNTWCKKGVTLCSSEQVLNKYICNLQIKMRHNTNSVVKEKKIVRDIKELEVTRERVVDNFAKKVRSYSLGGEAAIKDHIDYLGLELKWLRDDKQQIRARIKEREDEMKSISNEISLLQVQLTTTNEKRRAEYENLVELKKQIKKQRDGNNV